MSDVAMKDSPTKTPPFSILFSKIDNVINRIRMLSEKAADSKIFLFGHYSEPLKEDPNPVGESKPDGFIQDLSLRLMKIDNALDDLEKHINAIHNETI